MSQNEGFTGGFFVGAIVGGLVGGVLGSILASRQNQELIGEGAEKGFLKSGKQPKFKETEESIELARRSLEDKIAQLNLAIDDVRQQLGTVNENNKPNDLDRV